MTMTTSFCTICSTSSTSSSHLPFRPFYSSSSSSPLFYVPSHVKKGVSEREFLLLRLSCVSNRCSQSEPETTSSSPPLSEPSSSNVADISSDSGISAYKWCASLGGLGFLETTYLTYLKLTDGEAFCPTSGSSCNTILTSAYSSIFVEFFSARCNCVQLGDLDGISYVKNRMKYKWFCLSSRFAETELPYIETEITKESSPSALSLAKHLRSIGAKLYGAFWCSHCLDQKEMFGREAAKLLNSVECFPDGVKELKWLMLVMPLEEDGHAMAMLKGSLSDSKGSFTGFWIYCFTVCGVLFWIIDL